MIDSSFVQEVVKGAEVQRFEIPRDQDQATATFTTKPLTEIKPAPPPLAPLVNVSTLAGFADLVRNKLEDLVPYNLFIHVMDEHTVSLVGRVADKHGRRDKLIVATPVAFEQFRFGQFHEHEPFVIEIASKFADTPDRAYVIDVASSITVGATRAAEDDGLAQKVTVQRGMRVRGDLQVRNRVSLAPFRTFPETQQIASEFIFRLKGGTDAEPPKLALFEADGGKWKIAAINELRRYLEVLNLDIPVVA